ncbi:MAG: hypothetical protein K2J40_06650 [Ruminococcus sp.]|nr:hypothetical protein [Ruminococcus sp.]
MKNKAEIKFENQAFAEILHVAEYGVYNLAFETDGELKSPKNTIDVLSMLFRLLEENPETPAGRVYMGNQTEILHRTMLNLPEVINSFRDIEVAVITSVEDSEGNISEIKAVTNITISETTETQDND